MGSNVTSNLKQGSTTIMTDSKVLKNDDPLAERLKENILNLNEEKTILVKIRVTYKTNKEKF